MGAPNPGPSASQLASRHPRATRRTKTKLEELGIRQGAKITHHFQQCFSLGFSSSEGGPDSHIAQHKPGGEERKVTDERESSQDRGRDRQRQGLQSLQRQRDKPTQTETKERMRTEMPEDEK